MTRLSSFVPLALALTFCLVFCGAEAQAKKTIVEDQEVVPVEIRKTLATLNISTLYVDELPSPAVIEPGEVKPLDKAHILHVNRDAFRMIDIEVGDDDLLADQLDEIISYLSGKKPLPGTNPHSMRWAGTQLNFVFPDLGDSRSFVLGQVTNSKGEVFDLYLKGSGPTKATSASDRGKGRIPLQFAVRDYVLSEAAHRLGVPVARSLALIGSEDPIGEEEMAKTTSTMILKLALTNIRFGVFQNLHFEHKNEHIKTLADYSIKHHFPSLLSIPTERAVWMTDDDDDEDEFVCNSSRDDCPQYRYAEWLKHVLVRQVSLITTLKTFGLHMGLISTENLNVLGVLNDLDRASFIEVYTENSPLYCDRQNLYGFNKQSNVIGTHIMSFTRWIKAALGLTTSEIEDALEEVKTMIALTRNSYVIDKYGIVTASPHLTRFTEKVLNEVSLDFTEFHKFLSDVDMHAAELEGQCPFDMVLLAQSNKQFHTRERYQGVSKYLEAYREARWALTEEQRAERDIRMKQVNPRFIPRHYMIEWTASMLSMNRTFTRCLDILMERVTRPLEDHTPEDLANFASCGFMEGPKYRSREYYLHCHPAAGFSSESPEFVDNGLDKKSFFGAKGFITNFDDPVVYTPIK